jgi:hypothetical protein
MVKNISQTGCVFCLFVFFPAPQFYTAFLKKKLFIFNIFAPFLSWLSLVSFLNKGFYIKKGQWCSLIY